MSQNRLTEIQNRLTKAFSPTFLDVQDDSAAHKGHAGSRGGAGHYTVKMTADAFKNKSRVESHQMVYAVLADLIPHEIHALQIYTRG